MEDTHFHPLDYVSVVRRRRWWLTLPVVAAIVVGVLLVRYLPKEYRSTTTVGVAAAAVSPNLVNQGTPFDNQERLRAMSQQLVSLPILGRVIREEGLGPGSPQDPLIGQLRSAISISVPDPLAVTNEPRRFDTFVIAYTDRDPALAQRIANRLATVFVDESSMARAARAEDTSMFIATQLRASQTRLADLENQLRGAKEEHMGRLPEQTQANLQTLAGVRQQLQANATTLRGEQDRLSMTERQIEAVTQGGTDLLIVPGVTESAQAPGTRLLMLQRELGAARAVYTDRHPEVQRLTEAIEAARQDAAADRQQPAAERLGRLQADPVYRQLAADREAMRMRVRELQRAGTDLERQIGAYQARVEAAPMVEQALAALQRDYDLEKQQYNDLSSKLRTAMIAENVVRNRSGEQFAILYPASFPTTPARPNPLRVMLIAIVAGISLGGALALGREYLDRSVHDVRQLKDEFDVPVLGEVTRIQTA
jgi:polysaccharide chain length determinant protein (PEP-CTERM system associated)